MKDESQGFSKGSTTIDALYLPVIRTTGEVQVIVAYFKTGTTTYFTMVFNSAGSLANHLSMAGTLIMYTPSKVTLLTVEFAESQAAAIFPSFDNTLPPEYKNLIDCIIDKIEHMGLGTWMACAFDLEACVLVLAIDCAWEMLMD